MYASNLEEALYLLMDKSEASHADPSEFRARMESSGDMDACPGAAKTTRRSSPTNRLRTLFWASPQSNLDGPDMWPSFCGR